MNNSQKYTRQGQILLKRIDSTISLIGPARKALENHGSENVIFKQKIEKVARSVKDVVGKITEVKKEFVKQAANIEKKNLNSNTNYKASVMKIPIMKMNVYLTDKINQRRKAALASGKNKLLAGAKKLSQNKAVKNTVSKLKEGAALRNATLASGKNKLLAGAKKLSKNRFVQKAAAGVRNVAASRTQSQALNNFERQLKQIRTSVNKKNNNSSVNKKNAANNQGKPGFVSNQVGRIEGTNKD